MFPELEGYRCRAVYTLKEFERTPAEEKSIVRNGAVNTAEEERDSDWIIRREAMVITVSLVLVLFIVMLGAWLIKRGVEKREERSE